MILENKKLSRAELGQGEVSPVTGDDDVELAAEKDSAFRCMPHSRGTASDILEEGGDDVKSAWPLWAGP
ncbi:hypothetical protein VNO80_19507 [Phaseolus coccineus]|uniref:Uncharacterized protein n=1 Tax=Phaseolus coccineus TaxID=3886 RepID=A0AAN9R0A8_PHACN